MLFNPLHHLVQLLEHHFSLRESLLIKQPYLLLLWRVIVLQLYALLDQLSEVVVIVFNNVAFQGAFVNSLDLFNSDLKKFAE